MRSISIITLAVLFMSLLACTVIQPDTSPPIYGNFPAGGGA